MEKDQDLEKAISFMLWGSRGYHRPGDSSHPDFSIEKMLEYLREKKEPAGDDDL